jgi:flagellar assembly protein FliH
MKSSSAFEFAPLAEVEVLTPEAQGVRLAEASEIIDTARAEAEHIRQAAREEGFQAGFDQGMATAHDYLDPSVQALAAAQHALAEERVTAADAVEVHAVELALRIAEKALGAALEAKPEHVVDVVRGGLRRLLERDRVIVLVNPEDMELVREATGDLKASLGGIGELDVQAERRVARGGAIVRTQTGEVDGRLDTQLERARETLLEALKAPAAAQDDVR